MLPIKQLMEQRQKLPVFEHKEAFLRLLNQKQCIVLIGETGSGKTTQVPQWCVEYLKNSHLKVACTQPRRLSTISVARRVAEEMNVALGKKVGYSVRFENCTSLNTRLKFLTDGLLMRELFTYNNFDPYGIVILDEAHERSLNTDILLGFLKNAMRRRPQLKVIIMSATVNAEKFCEYFSGCSVLRIPGRLFSVDTHYMNTHGNKYRNDIVSLVSRIHITNPPGDILVFLTGEQEIEEVCEKIRVSTSSVENIVGKLIVFPLYSVLSQEEQQEIFNPVPTNYLGVPLARKCIVSTNIAETSLTIDGVHYIVDSGRCKQKRFLPKSRIDQFTVEPISKASAEQRAGRAGRTAGGKCFRMYTELFYNQMEEYSVPEILKCNFANVALLLKRLGVADLNNFNYMVSPKPEAIQHATDLLRDLGALDQMYNITTLGVLMAEFPVDPPLAKMLIMASRKYKCANEILTLVSVLSAPPIFSRPRKKATEADQKHAVFVHPDGDHLTMINVFNAYVENPENEKFNWCSENFLRFESLHQAQKIRSQLYDLTYKLQLDCTSLDLKHKDYSINIRKCILEGFFTQVANRIVNGIYSNLKDPESSHVLIHQTSQMRNTPPDWLIYNELNRMERSNVMRIVSSINVQWLFEVAPHYFSDLESWPAGLVKERLSNAKAEFDLYPFENTLRLN